MCKEVGIKRESLSGSGILLSYRTYGGRALYGEWGAACTECLFSGRTDTDLKGIQWRTDGDFHEESAIVHMVDKVVTKLDLLDKETFSTTWNQDMVIYQTLNENSATGIYDESGLSMNQFLTIRDFLVKGDHLFDSDNRE